MTVNDRVLFLQLIRCCFNQSRILLQRHALEFVLWTLRVTYRTNTVKLFSKKKKRKEEKLTTYLYIIIVPNKIYKLILLIVFYLDPFFVHLMVSFWDTILHPWSCHCLTEEIVLSFLKVTWKAFVTYNVQLK